jgi:hypothetical protein
VPAIEIERSPLTGGTETRSGLATSLVLFGLFLVSVYFLPSFTCEERERGLLLAQALSPASPREIVLAKFVFYAALAVALGTAIAGVFEPAVLTRLGFWTALAVATAGTLGIGLMIASLAQTQRVAGMAAVTYGVTTALLLLLCRQKFISGVSWLLLEYHCPTLIHAAFASAAVPNAGWHLASAAALATLWCWGAVYIFKRRGWQN